MCFPIPSLPNRTCLFPGLRLQARWSSDLRSVSLESCFQFIAGLRIEHHLDSLHLTIYACIHHRLPSIKAIVQAYRMLPSRRTPFALRWAFPTAIDYYKVLRPRITTSDAAVPSLMTQGQLCGFSCSIGMSLPGLGRHPLCTGGSILTVTPLYRQATLFKYVSLSDNGKAS